MSDIDALLRDLKKYGTAGRDCALSAEDALAIVAALEAAQKLDRLASTGTADGFLALPDDAKRRWFAASLVESSRRKKAEEALEAAREDAARYRWLRVRWGRITETFGTEPEEYGCVVSPESLDAAIDAALAKAGDA